MRLMALLSVIDVLVRIITTLSRKHRNNLTTLFVILVDPSLHYLNLVPQIPNSKYINKIISTDDTKRFHKRPGAVSGIDTVK